MPLDNYKIKFEKSFLGYNPESLGVIYQNNKLVAFGLCQNLNEYDKDFLRYEQHLAEEILKRKKITLNIDIIRADENIQEIRKRIYLDYADVMSEEERKEIFFRYSKAQRIFPEINTFLHNEEDIEIQDIEHEKREIKINNSEILSGYRLNIKIFLKIFSCDIKDDLNKKYLTHNFNNNVFEIEYAKNV